MQHMQRLSVCGLKPHQMLSADCSLEYEPVKQKIHMLREAKLQAEKELIRRVQLFGSVMCKSVNIRATTQLCALLFVPICQAFLPNFWSRVLTLSWDSYTHQYMTEQAILNITVETLSTIMEQAKGGDKEELYTGLGRGFWHAVGEVASANAAMDFLSSTRSDPIYHFDSERVEGAIEILREFWSQTLLLTKSKEYQGARRRLGQLFHSLQDFYSHSNWVEMGKQDVYLHLLHPEESAVPVASEDIPTCAECYRFSCYNNLLKEMIQGETEPLLTTGYFSSFPDKPAGKCSHGGILDSSRHHGAEGGINKDSTSPVFSPHHYLHKEAARLAATATLRVLQDLRDEVGPKSFLSLFRVQQPPALTFVIDTTGSMFEEITAARLRAFSIIKARERSRRTSLPGTFILVPFHDPDFGPVKETDDPEEFMLCMENLMALGGGDEPEMCLSALQLALTHSPPLSEIFVFTDASPKDHYLQGAVQALILEKQIKVNFLLTEDPSVTSRGRLLRKRRGTLSPDRFSLYSSLSSVSGGMTIFTTNKDILKVSAIVEDTTTSSKVTLFHIESKSDSSNSFRVDEAVRNVKLHITGQIKLCELISPSGSHQFLPGSDGPLAVMDSSQGLYRISLLPPLETGVWQLVMRAIEPVTFSVQGDSRLDFLYYFAKEANDTHPGLRKVEGSPIAGTAAFLVVLVTGLSPSENDSFSHVTLLGPNGESLLKVLLNSSSPHWSEEVLVGHMDSVPRMPFSLRLTGTDGRGNLLERVSTETIQPTHVQIQVFSTPYLLPGNTSTVMFEILNHGPNRHFILSAEDDYGYLSHTERHRNKLFIAERSSVKEELELNTPHNAQTDRPITLTLTVHAEDSPDSNYAVVYLTVIPEQRDTSPPACSALRVESACPSVCSQGSWKVSLVARDRGHSGLASVQLAQGEGILTLSQVTMERNRIHFPQLHEKTTGVGLLPLLQRPKNTSGSVEFNNSQPSETEAGHETERSIQLVKGEARLNISEGSDNRPIMMSYSSGCCAPRAELVLWDRAGNMRRCHLIASQKRALREKNLARSETSRPLFVLLLYTHLILSVLQELS